jgi:hypothetical protein
MARFNKQLTGKIQRLKMIKFIDSTIKLTSFHKSQIMPEKIVKFTNYLPDTLTKTTLTSSFSMLQGSREVFQFFN